MKTFLSTLLLAGLATGGFASENDPLWMRYGAISPDGSTIAFCYKGDIFTVPAQGGTATQITSHPAYDTRPVWSPDGNRIAFASNREKSFDIYIVDKQGGMPRKLTSHSGAEYPLTFRDQNTLLFKAAIQPAGEYAQFPSGQFSQIYSVNTDGGRPQRISSHPMEDLKVSNNGELFLYHDKKGYEDEWRKHHVSSITRDIWLHKPATGEFSKLTSFRGEDRNPVFAPDGRTFYYLSEQDGTFNVYKSSVDQPDKTTQITNFKQNPVRFLSLASNGTLSFSQNGELYTMREGETPHKVSVSIFKDKIERDKEFQRHASGARDIALSPNGKEVAFILRGDVYVTSIEYASTKQITNTAEQERNLTFSPDGRSLIYSSERNGIWNIYQTELPRKQDKYFTYASELKETPLTTNTIASFQPEISPDGKTIAYLENRTTIKLLDIKSGKSRTLLDGQFNYSYADGDQWFSWSPDSKWLLSKYIGVGGWNNVDIALINAETGALTNLTESGYSDNGGDWVLNGKAMMWGSDRAGYRSHGSWGAQFDLYLMFFDDEAYSKFNMSKEELALWEETDKEAREEKEKAEKEAEKKEKEEKKTGDIKPEKVKPLELELEGRRNRTVRLTRNSSNLGGGYLTKDGSTLYYTAAFESGYDLWVMDLKEGSVRILVKGVSGAGLVADKDEKALYLLAGGGIKKVDIPSGAQKQIAFSSDFEYKPSRERNYMFDHAWQQVSDKFYDPKIHGVDWKGYKETYARFLPHINNNIDFAEMLGEMLGELNGSHTGARCYSGGGAATACLGAFYDETYQGDGLKVKEVIKRGPLALAMQPVEAGSIIEKIDGKPILAGQDYFPLLEQKAGRPVLLSIRSPKGKTSEVKVKPIYQGEEQNLLYNRWVEQCRTTVDKLSNGRIGYVHVRGMDSNSFRETYSELLGRCRNKEAVIVDTRHNGGGWLHDDLATLLSGKVYQQFAPRGQFIGNDPFNKWTKPSCVLICEDNYSNAHGFPWVYKQLEIGKLIGAPVPGTMTAVWWESQIDPSIVFGIPQVGCRDMNGNYLENQELQPDIEVYNEPAAMLQGKDQQLERAIEEMLREIAK